MKIRLSRVLGRGTVLLITWKERVMKSDFKNNCNDNLFIACDSDKINQVLPSRGHPLLCLIKNIVKLGTGM
jgi:hypothetical protein